MFEISTRTTHSGRVVVSARSDFAQGTIELRVQGGMVMGGDFCDPMPTAAAGLLLAALAVVRELAPPPPVITAETTFTARVRMPDSFEPDEGPEQEADVVITADGHPDQPIATYDRPDVAYLGCEDLDTMLKRHGWRRVGPGRIDEFEYNHFTVKRIRAPRR